jgi:two-component system sensor histidine kinase GlrK
MRVATRIAAGYGILLALLAAALGYQLLRVHQLEAISRSLAGSGVRASLISLGLLRNLDQVEEFTRKEFATGGDPGYAGRVAATQRAFADQLRELQSLPLSPPEQAAIAGLAAVWNRPQPEAALEARLASLQATREAAEGVIRATQAAIQAQARESAEASREAERASRWAATMAAAVSLVVSLWIILSISRPLRRLTAGTQAVAAGQFSHTLEERGPMELAALARDFNVMTQRLGELDQMKKDFVAHVSHELKAPLLAVVETIRLLLEETVGPLTERQRHFLELNLASCQRLSALINNLLDLSRLEAGVMEYDIQKHDLGALVRRALGEFEAQLQGDRVQLELPDAAVTVDCDGDRLIQVFGNLVSNALKFSPPGSAIRIRLAPSVRLEQAPDREFALVTVADCGPGVAPTDRQRIFEKFYRRSQAKKTAAGAGLGLAISKAIIEAHGGAIWVDGNSGGGSAFHVALLRYPVS